MPISIADYLLMQARLDSRRVRQNVRPVETEKIAPVERELHRQILAECRARGWLCFHGSMAHRTFRTVGENDFHCLLPGGLVLFVEGKGKTTKLTTEQLGLQAWMKKLGHTLHVVRSLAEFFELAQGALHPEAVGGSRSFPRPEVTL